MTVTTYQYEATDPRLGRHIEHDERSLRFAHPVLPTSALQPIEWTRRTPILDQGQLGSCTGNALTGVLGTDFNGHTATDTVQVKADGKGVFTGGTYTLDEDFAVKAYTLNTLLDSFPGQYPPTDTGSSSLAAGKTGKLLGLFSGYTHAFSLQAMQSALQLGPVMIGIPWLQSMFDPQSDGTVVVDQNSGVAGGHELAVSAWDGGRFRIDNSWGTSWGAQGSGWIANDDMRWLLGQGGDVLVPTPAVAPAPTPAPPPAPAVDADVLAAYHSLQAWAKANNVA